MGLECLINELTKKKKRKCILMDENYDAKNVSEKNTFKLEKYYTVIHLLFNISEIFNADEYNSPNITLNNSNIMDLTNNNISLFGNSQIRNTNN